MEPFDRHTHWEKIYQTKQLNEVSWFQPTPQTSLDFVHEFNLPKTAKVIDVGGGDSFFVDHLLAEGFTDITVLDISETAINRAKQRLGDKANMVKWLVADAATFVPDTQFDFWHDRAAFHFLTNETEIAHYLSAVENGTAKNAVVVVGTFSEQGPTKCSGIEIKQYSENSLAHRFERFLEKIRCFTVDHITPANKIQNFIFCSFKKPSLA